MYIHMYSTYTHAVCLTAGACPALQEEYLQSHCGEETHSLLHKMVEGTALMDFVHSRPIPYRSCDFFDEVCASFRHSYVTPSPPHLRHTITFTPPPHHTISSTLPSHTLHPSHHHLHPSPVTPSPSPLPPITPSPPPPPHHIITFTPLNITPSPSPSLVTPFTHHTITFTPPPSHHHLHPSPPSHHHLHPP